MAESELEKELKTLAPMIRSLSGFQSLQDLDNLPEELKTQRVFCTANHRRIDGKLCKCAYDIHTDRYFCKNYPMEGRLCALTELVHPKHSYAEDGCFAIGLRDDMCALEIDQCINDSGDPSKEAAAIMAKMNTYTEKTPSGMGLRLLFKAPGFQFDESIYDTENPGIGLELYVPNGIDSFATVTGDSVTTGLGIEERSGELQEVLDMYLRKDAGVQPPPNAPAVCCCSDNGGAVSDGGSGSEQQPDGHDNMNPVISKQNESLLIVYTKDGAIPLDQLSPESYGRWDDIWLSRLFADMYKFRCRYVRDQGLWYIYNGKAWEADIGGTQLEALIMEFTERLHEYACSRPTPRNGNHTACTEFIKYTFNAKSQRVRNIIKADADSIDPLESKDFDKDLYTLNCLNGTLDLHTLELRPHDPKDFITKTANVAYDPQACSQSWLNHMDAVTGGDAELKKYIQKCFGYGLTGSTMYECLFILYGATSRNGKGTTMETYTGMLGDYAKAANPDTLAQKLTPNGSGPNEDLARLAGARVVNCSEPEKKMQLANAFIKTLTGNDTVPARFMYKHMFEFKPNFKIFINTNYLPRTNDITVFRSGRIKVIPFKQRFVGKTQNIHLKEELRKPSSLSGVLRWCIEGLRLLENEGFNEPQAVKDATDKYAEDSDRIARFIEEYMEEQPCAEIVSQKAYDVYCYWCKKNGHFTESQATFKQSMESHGAKIRRARPRGSKSGANAQVLIQGFAWRYGFNPDYYYYTNPNMW